MAEKYTEQKVLVPAGEARLEGVLSVPEGAQAVVIFAHGSGSSRHSPRNRFVAREILKAGIGALLFDLLTVEEDSLYLNRFNIALLAERLKAATAWLEGQPLASGLRKGYFGASTGSAAALMAAAEPDARIGAIVSRGGRPDLAEQALAKVKSPTLLIVGGFDFEVLDLNRKAYGRIEAEKKELKIVPGATHLFEEPGALEEVARLASDWFERYLVRAPARVF
ncbi:MAG: dienelactone hydrolase family protein [Nitrospiraceae bacterium]|nr:dienelactone hydrolase family protein [Nitrospiraceae bacterium]